MPQLIINVKTENGTELGLVVEPMEGTPGYYFLLNSVEGFGSFDGIFIDGSDVFTLDVKDGKKKLHIGTRSNA